MIPESPGSYTGKSMEPESKSIASRHWEQTRWGGLRMGRGRRSWETEICENQIVRKVARLVNVLRGAGHTLMAAFFMGKLYSIILLLQNEIVNWASGIKINVLNLLQNWICSLSYKLANSVFCIWHLLFLFLNLLTLWSEQLPLLTLSELTILALFSQGSLGNVKSPLGMPHALLHNLSFVDFGILFKDRLSWPGEKAQLVKCLPSKHKNLNLIPRIMYLKKEPGVVVCA